MTYTVVLNNNMGNYIQEQFKSKEIETYRMFNHYAAEAVRYFMQVQGSGNQFWTNRTFKAANSFFSQAIARKDELVLQFAYDGTAKNKNGVDYTKYLETSNEGRFAALPSILERFAVLLLQDLKILYGDKS